MRRIVLACIVALMLLPVSAMAARNPSVAERNAVRIAAVSAHDISAAQAVCTRVRISTVDARWASLDFVLPPSKACEKYAANGIALFRRRAGHWRFVAVGSAYRCGYHHIPGRVLDDLVFAGRKVC